MTDHLIIFDFDGVIADSEMLANTVLADVITELGVPTTLDDAYRLYMGKRLSEVLCAIEATVGNKLTESFPSEFQERTFDRFRKDLRLVNGARTYIESFLDLPKCIASSSSPDRLELCLDILDLKDVFGDAVFSASNVVRGKPHPDIFLYAAEKMTTPVDRCIVIEDSPTGVMAAKAAGMTVVGLLAGSHIQPDHGDKLKSAGADHIALTFHDAKQITQQFLGAPRRQR